LEGHRRQAIIYMVLGLGWIAFWLRWMSGPVAGYFATVGGLMGLTQGARTAIAAGALSISVGALVFLRGFLLYRLSRPGRAPRLPRQRPRSRW